MSKTVQIFFVINIFLMSLQCNGQRRPSDYENIRNTGQVINWKINKDIKEYCFNADSGMMKEMPDILTIKIEEVLNPGLIPVNLSLSFKSADKKYEIGNITFFPPDKPGIFRFRITQILKELKKDNAEDVLRLPELCLEINLNDKDLMNETDKMELELKIKYPEYSSENK